MRRKARTTCCTRCGTRCTRTPLWERSATRCVTSGASIDPAANSKQEVSVMAIEWNPSRGATLGVEWELQLIDAESRMLRQEAGKLLAELPVIGDTRSEERRVGKECR